MQQIIVILIIALALLFAVRHYYRQLTGRNGGCDCCPHSGGQCHCHECKISS